MSLFPLAFAGLLAFVIQSAAAPLQVVATTTMVSDMVADVGGDRVKVEGLMGPGVDPHLFKATASDVAKLHRADIVFYSGLLLEGKLQNIFLKLARSQKHVYAVTEDLSRERLLEPEEFQGHYDPHVWFDIPLWSKCVPTVVKGLSAVDPSNQAYYEKRGKALQERWAKLHEWVKEKIAELPADKRILVTSHDAYNYFGRAYDFQVVGLQGISTESQAGLADMVRLVDFIKENRIPAIFIESSVSPKAIQRISQDAGVKIGGELFSDAMGPPGKIENGYDVSTYEGMIHHNINTIVNELK